MFREVDQGGRMHMTQVRMDGGGTMPTSPLPHCQKRSLLGGGVATWMAVKRPTPTSHTSLSMQSLRDALRSSHFRKLYHARTVWGDLGRVHSMQLSIGHMLNATVA